MDFQYVRLKGWDVRVTIGDGFVTAIVIDKPELEVFVDTAEHDPLGKNPTLALRHAQKVACERLHDRIEQDTRNRRRRWARK